MRYHYEKKSLYLAMYGETYICNHPLYDRCTLFKINEKGLAIIQQRFNAQNKTTWWSEIDSYLVDDLYLHPDFKEYFNKRASMPELGLYPTVTIRQIMWALKMKPLLKNRWETMFDRKDI